MTAFMVRVILIVLMSGIFYRMLGNIIDRTFYDLRDTLTSPKIRFVVYIVGIGGIFADCWEYIRLVSNLR